MTTQPAPDRTLATDELLAWEDVAKALKCSRATAFRVMKQLPTRHIPGVGKRTWRSDLDRWLAENALEAVK